MDSHYVSVFANFAVENVLGYERVLLAFSPLENESSLDADEYYKFLIYILGLYNKSWSNVVALVGDK